MLKKSMHLMTLLLIILIGTACSFVDMNLNAPTGDGVEVVPTANVVSDSSTPPYSDLIAGADAVFLGRVSFISSTQSVSGSPVMTHQISLAVVQAGSDNIGIGTGIVMTVPGQSPVDDILVVGDGTLLQGTAVHQLQVGDEVVVFAKLVDFVTGDINRAVLMPVPELGQPFLPAEHWDRVYTAVTVPRTNTN